MTKRPDLHQDLVIGSAIAGVVVLAMCSVAWICTWAVHYSPSDCIRFQDAPWVLNANGVMMACKPLDEQSLDIECRPLEVKPCPK